MTRYFRGLRKEVFNILHGFWGVIIRSMRHIAYGANTMKNLEKNINKENTMTKIVGNFIMPEIDFDSDIDATKLDDFVEDELKINFRTGFESDLFGDVLQRPDILQKIKLKIDENGAEGAAATITAIST